MVSIWTTFLSSIKQSLPCFIQQRVSQKLYESLISRSLPPLSNISQPQPRTILSEDELNIVQYTAGYVPHKLLKKHYIIDLLSQHILYSASSKWQLVELKQAYVTWTKLINRGNLFEISDSTFLFFEQVELIVQNKLKFALQEHNHK